MDPSLTFQLDGEQTLCISSSALAVMYLYICRCDDGSLSSPQKNDKGGYVKLKSGHYSLTYELNCRAGQSTISCMPTMEAYGGNSHITLIEHQASLSISIQHTKSAASYHGAMEPWSHGALDIGTILRRALA